MPSQEHRPATVRTLVVSIHDVSPITWPAVLPIMAALRGIGLRRVSLLVIPNHHHRGHFLEHKEFCSWLREQTAEGNEIVIHGYHHSRPQKPSDAMASRFVTSVYTAGEGEFYDMSRAEALLAVSTAQKEFGELGLHPGGFIAPAWLLSEPAEDALRTLGCAYTTRLRTVVDLVGRRTFHSQSLVYSVRSGWRRTASRAWNAFLHRRLRQEPLLRIGIHPPDFLHGPIRRQILRHVAHALRDRTAMTYEEWIGSERLKNGE